MQNNYDKCERLSYDHSKKFYCHITHFRLLSENTTPFTEVGFPRLPASQGLGPGSIFNQLHSAGSPCFRMDLEGDMSSPKGGQGLGN